MSMIVYKVISGSRAYGLDTPTSDVDERGIFLESYDKLLGLYYTPQISSATNDTIFYELKRFIELVEKNNPNILEILNIDKEFVIIEYPGIELMRKDLKQLISKEVFFTFGGYAISQIIKARGLNKKITQTFNKERDSIEKYCYILVGKGYSYPLQEWLASNNLTSDELGLTKTLYGRNLYYVYAGYEGKKGISSTTSNELRLQEIPKNAKDCWIGTLYFDRDNYSRHCKEHREYWEWVEKRNPHRYADNMSHGENYDGKNMMHCVRLLEMGIEILKTGDVIVKRPNRDFLLSIRRGEIPYNELFKLVESKQRELEEAYKSSPLPEKPEHGLANALLLKHRKKLSYNANI